MQARLFIERLAGPLCLTIALFVLIQTTNAVQMPIGQKKSKIGLTSVAMASLNDSESALVNPLHTFGANLFKIIRNNKENQLISPISIHSALSMLQLGATPNSQTERELKDFLHFPDKNPIYLHESYKKMLAIFKAVTETSAQVAQKSSDFEGGSKSPAVIDAWSMAISKGPTSIEPSFVEDLKKYYSSSVRHISDNKPGDKKQLANDINKWAEISGFGDGLITESQLSEQFSMLLMSAIRVESSWFESFEEYRFDDLFYNYGLKSNVVNGSNGLTGLTVTDIYAKFVEFSKDERAEHKFYTNRMKAMYPDDSKGLLPLNFQAIEVPLEGNLSYTIFKPINTVTGNELQQLEEQLLTIEPSTRQTKLAKALNLLDTKEARHKLEFLRMPPYKFENDISLKQPLSSIGLKRIFDKDKAEFSNISSTRQFVSEAKHQSVIEVNKNGLKAAAVTTIKIMPLSLHISMHPIRVTIDNPFMFVIRYNKIPLFLGHVVHI